MAGTQQKIILYALLSCPYCRRLKEYLDDKGINYDLILVDLLTGEERTSALDNLKQKNPALSFPTLIIGNRVIVGFQPKEVDNTLNKVGTVRDSIG